MLNEHVGLKRGTVEVVSYDAMWPQLFEEEKGRLAEALRGKVYSSTSVPGLAVKPLIDMIAAIDSLGVYKELIAPLEKLGYEFMPERVFEIEYSSRKVQEKTEPTI